MKVNFLNQPYLLYYNMYLFENYTGYKIGRVFRKEYGCNYEVILTMEPGARKYKPWVQSNRRFDCDESTLH